MKITACLIVKNESKNIVKCISSFKDVADEVIVIDTGSDDDTVSLAESLGAKVLLYKWNNDFASARNFALDHASGDWVIFLDADEYIHPEHAQKLKRLFNVHQKNRQCDGISTRMIHIDTMNGNILGSHMVIRFFRNTSKIRYKGKIHEELIKGATPLDVVVDNEIIIYHTGYSMDIVHTKSLRNLNQLESIVSDGKADAMTFYYLSSCCFSLGKYREAIEYAKRALQDSTGFKSIEIRNSGCSLYTIYIESMLAQENAYSDEEIYSAIAEARRRYKDHPEIKRYEAIYYRKEMHYDMALTCFLQAIDLNKGYSGLERNDFMGRYHEVLADVGHIYELKNELLIALDYYVSSLKIAKYNDFAFRGLIEIIKHESLEDVTFFVNSLYDINSLDDIRFLVRNLGQMRAGLPFIYYFKIWNGTFNQWDISAIIALLISGNTQDALNMAYDFYIQSGDKYFEFMAIVSLIKGNASDWYEVHKSDIDSSYRGIIDVYLGKGKGSNSEEEHHIYLKILTELILLADEVIIESFISSSSELKEVDWITLGDFCRDNHLYNRAIKYYLKAYSQTTNNSRCYAGIGFCSFKVLDYDNSLKYIEKAMLDGYQDYDVLELVKWIYEKANHADTKTKAENLIEKYKVAKEK